MDVQSWDTVFIRAPRARIHPVVSDLRSWPTWWPGMSVQALDAEFAVTLRSPGLARRSRTWTARVTKNRRALGINLAYAGSLAGEGEFYYLDEPTGTLVHYLLRADVSERGWRGALRDHRAGVRAGLHALKDRFEAGRLPGQEPEPALLDEQRAATAAFAEGVAASRSQHARQVAAAASRRGGVA